ncbi:MAG: GxxExxY protein [Bacteroidota bacterium]|nr:GxxExxY protein [Bacteroidota bacterium]
MNQKDSYLHSDITSKIIKAFYEVYNTLGYGFLEKVYENALLIELKKSGFECKKQTPISVFYDEINVGEYYADIIVNDCVIIELKAAECLMEEHEAQLINYLRATNMEVGLLLNFGKEAEIKRKAFNNHFKNHKPAMNQNLS